MNARESQSQAESNVTLAEREYKRAQELLAKGFISQSRVDEAERQLQVVRSQLASAKSQVSAEDTQGAKAQQAREQLAEAEAALQLAQARLAQTEIRASAAAVVLERLVEPGDIAQASRRMLVLALDGAARLIAQVDEKNLPLLQTGSKALAKMSPRWTTTRARVRGTPRWDLFFSFIICCRRSTRLKMCCCRG